VFWRRKTKRRREEAPDMKKGMWWPGSLQTAPHTPGRVHARSCGRWEMGGRRIGCVVERDRKSWVVVVVVLML
jgi:hypothetical protein